MTTAHDPMTGSGDGATIPGARDRLVFTIAEAAEVLGISRAFAYELAARGELPVLRLGRRRLVPRRALFAMVGEEEGNAEGRADVQPAATQLYRLVPEAR